MNTGTLPESIYQAKAKESRGYSIRVSNTLWAMLDEVAKARGVSRNQIIRANLVSIVEEHHQQQVS